MRNWRVKFTIFILVVQAFYSCLSLAAALSCSQLFAETALDVKTEVNTVSSELLKFQKDILKSPIELESEAVQRGYFKFGTRQVENVNSETHTKIQFKTLKNGTLEALFTYDLQALQQPAVLITEALFYKMIVEGDVSSFPKFTVSNEARKGLLAGFESRTSNFNFIELYRNAEQGDLSAQIRLTRWKIDLIKNLKLQQGELKQPAELIKSLKELSQKLENEVKEKLDLLEKKKLNVSKIDDLLISEVKELVKNNDRRGVARLLNEKLSWDQFTHSERNAWKLWIEAIENPDPAQMVWAFRGLQNGEVNTVIQNPAQENPAFFSPLMGRKENAQNLFFEGLSKAREAYGDADHKTRSSQFIESDFKISDLLASHSEAKSKNSIFLGFSMNLEIAERFVSGNGQFGGKPGALLVVRLDRRRLAANIQSGFGKEFEVLAPLFVFPDEVMVYFKNYSENQNRTQLLERVKQLGGPADDYIGANEVQTFKSMGRSLYHTLFGL